MLQSEKDAERYYQAQAKFEQRQRMIDKGWGDKEEYNKVVAIQKRKSTIKSLKECFTWWSFGWRNGSCSCLRLRSKNRGVPFMKAANEVFETWYSANFVEEKGDDDIKALFREAFEAGMVSGIYFVETNLTTFAEKLTADYEGFHNE